MNKSNKHLIRRTSLSIAGKDNADYPVVQAEYFQRASNTHVLNPYGLCTNPPKGSMGITFLIGGNEENKATLFNSDPDRFRGSDGTGLKEGEVALTDYLAGSYVWFKENGDIEIDSKNNTTINIAGDATVTVGGSMTATVTGNTTITTPLLTLNGNLTVTGQTTLADVTSNGKDTGSSHGHDQPNDSAGNTEAQINGVI